MPPLASIIIRTFNEEKHLEKLLHEIQNQITDFEYETIIVDSGSTDRTLEIAKRYATIIKSINPNDFSFGYSLNCGIKEAKGKYSVIISAHCYPVDNHWLANLIIPFQDSRIALVYGKQVGVEKTRFSEHQIFSKWFPDHNVDDCTLYFCNNANSAIRNSVWKNCPFNEELTGLEDIDWGKKVKENGNLISYKANACIFHIHEENSKQIYRRYYREALAYKAIFPNEHFGFWDFTKLFTINCLADYFHAYEEKKILKNLLDIPLFRLLQFWGTYQAHRYKAPLSKEMRRRLYYPKRPGIFSASKKRKKATTILPPKMIDITKPLTEQLPVWPGDQNPEIKQVKNHKEHGVNVSHLSFNIHTGTHVDAPFHFVPSGKRMQDIPLDRMIGKAFVIETHQAPALDRFHLEKMSIPNGINKLLLKTSNSHQGNCHQTFNENFIHITADAANWIVENGFHLIGIDGPSIQGYHEKDNRTHQILLENDIIILEGLNLATVSTGEYQLIALPMSIPEAEGAPVRAVLLKD